MVLKQRRVLIPLMLVFGLCVSFFPVLVSAAPGEWNLQTVDHTQVYNTSMALDSNGYPHISYYDGTNSELKYTYWNGFTWVFQTVDTDAGDAFLALDSNNQPHISYYDTINRDLKYARWTGTTWDITVVDSTDDVGRFSSLALDSNNHPHISYTDDTNTALKYARGTGSSWLIDTVDNVASSGAYWTSIVLDSGNYPHISYQDYHDNYDLKYARWTGTIWDITVVDSADMVGWSTSIALDSNNYPHISYYDSTNYGLKYARWDGSSWMVESVDTDGRNGTSTSIALDKNNRPHISYSYTNESYTNNALKYAHWTGTAWVKEIVEEGFSERVGGTSIALNHGRYPHISFATFSTGSLHYAFMPIPFPWNLFLPALTQN